MTRAGREALIGVLLIAAIAVGLFFTLVGISSIIKGAHCDVGDLQVVLAQSDDDPHAGQPDHCSNAHTNPHKCECQRAMKCKHEQSKEEDSHCQTYCRRDSCRCIDPCTT